MNGEDDIDQEEIRIIITQQEQKGLDEQPHTRNEIREIVKNLKINKSPGSDNITAEMFKYGGERLIEQMEKLLRKIWIQEQLPCEWTEAILCPIYKKGDRMECQNYRGIALLNAAYKILAMYLKNKLNSWSWRLLSAGDYYRRISMWFQKRTKYNRPNFHSTRNTSRKL